MTEPNVDIIIDCHDIELLLAFWAAALGTGPAGPGSSTACCCPMIPYTHQ